MPSCACIDVGASYYVPPAWQYLLSTPSTTFVAVEPNSKNLNYLKNWKYPAKFKICATGLSKKGGNRTLFITNTESGSSLNPPKLHLSIAHRWIDTNYFFPLKKKIVPTKTLEEVLNKYSDNCPVVLKIDTQGSELEILHSGRHKLETHKVVGVEIEAPLLAMPVMSGSGKFWEANRDLESWGYELLEIKPFSCASVTGNSFAIGKRAVWECDAVFAVRRDVAKKLPENFRLLLFYFYLTYEFYEEALSLIAEDKEIKQLLANKLENDPKLILENILKIPKR